MMGVRLSVRIFSLVGATLALAAALLAYYVSQVRNVTIEYTTALTRTIAQAEMARDMQFALVKQINAWREIARLHGRTRQEVAKYTEEFTWAGDQVSVLSNELFGSVSDTKLKTKIEHFRIAHLEFAKSLPRQPVVRVRVRGRKTHIAVRMPDNSGRSLVVLAAQVASDLSNQTKDLALRQREAIARQETIVLCASVPIVLSILVATILVAWTVSNRAREISDVFSRFTNGDLTQRIGDRATSAWGSTGENLNEFIDSLSKNLRDISNSAVRLECATDELSACMARQSAGAKSQKAQASKAARTLQEFSSSIVQLSADSARAAESARKLSDAARQGNRRIEEQLNGMRTNVASTDETTHKLELLGSGLGRITRITKAVEGIADQANLLAVNAEVDEARGNGHQAAAKSYADAIRKLEDCASKAAKEIAEVAGSVHEETKVAVAAATNGANQLREGLTVVTQAGATLQEIFQSAEQVFGVMRIPTLIAAQSSATEEMKSCLEEIERIAAETIEGAGESAFACKEVSQAVAGVQAIVGRFKLADNASVSAVRNGGAGARPRMQAQLAKSETAVSAEPVGDELSPEPEGEGALARRSAAASLA